jgi:hypothetical protein
MSNYIRNENDKKIVEEIATDLEAELGIKSGSRRTVKKTVQKSKRKVGRKSGNKTVPNGGDPKGQTSDADQMNDSSKTKASIESSIANTKPSVEAVPTYDESSEIWLDISGIEDIDVLVGRYRVSNLGRIMNTRTLHVLKPQRLGRYLGVNLYDSNLTPYPYAIHIVVASTFIPLGASDVPLEVDHINTKRHDNRAINLRFIHHPGNCQNYHDTKEEKYKPILQFSLNGELIKEWTNARCIFKAHQEYKRPCIYLCLTGKNHTSYGYKWKYKFPQVRPPEIIQDDEIFKNIGIMDGCDYSNYMISNYGQVRSLLKDKLMKPQDTGDYYSIGLRDADTGDLYDEQIHRLVAFVFVDGRTIERDFVNHLDENGKNNHYKNLEWVTKQENAEYSLAKKVNQLDPKTGEIINTFASITKACYYLGLNHDGMCTEISYACSGKHKLTRGFRWEYASDDQSVSTDLVSLESLKSMEGEVWKDIKGYEDYYEISNKGKIWSKKHRVCLAKYIDGKDYTITLSKDNKTRHFSVGRLLGIHFIDNPLNLRFVVYVDGNRLNISLDNLRWSKSNSFREV